MPKLTIDGIEIEVEAGTSVLQACEALGIEVPRFCYHERLSVAGNCRMCLVDMERAPKPVASCCMPVGEGMVIRTDTERVRKARNGVMEFLLINHPLDCPICDQGGECDLQDQAVAYGKNVSRYDENKRAVKNKEFGPLIKTVMTRCIHCTRCIRFAEEIAGVPVLGATYRGENMEVGTYVEKTLDSELSGNLVDICPVGALTSKPYAFHARPWELRKFESIDAMDAVGSNIRVDVRGGQVMRVLPRLNEAVNEEWISDKTRHAIDGLMKRRLDKPYVRGADGKLKAASWDEAFGAIAKRVAGLDGSKIGAIAGNQADAESMLLLKELMQSLGVASIDCRQDGAKLDATSRAGYLFNTTIGGIEQADAVLLIGTNPRKEAAIINARLRKRWTMGGFPVGVIGPQIDLTYDHSYLGAGPQSLEALLKGEGDFAAKLKAAERPMIIVGMGALTRADGAAVLAAARQLAEQVGAVTEGWNGFNVLHTAAARVGGLDLGLVPAAGGRDVAGILDGADKGEVEVVYLLGADEIDASRLGKAFVIYQGHHGDVGAHHADVVLPGAAYTEKEGTYVNTEGRVQRGRKAAFAPGDAREDWAILRALSAHLSKTLPYDDLASVRRRLVEVNPAFAHVDDVAPSAWGAFGAAGAMDAAPFGTAIDNFYQTCAISRASATMAECTEAFVKGRQEEGKTGTHG